MWLPKLRIRLFRIDAHRVLPGHFRTLGVRTQDLTSLGFLFAPTVGQRHPLALRLERERRKAGRQADRRAQAGLRTRARPPLVLSATSRDWTDRHWRDGEADSLARSLGGRGLVRVAAASQ